MKRAWWKEAVVYQIYPRSFMDSNGDGIGDLKGITSKLDYLKNLGIDVIWLSPVYKSPNDDNGYDISDYRDIMNEFGTLSDWEEMLEEMHKRGIKLVMDLVVNHTSDEHKWFVESKKSKDSEYRDYYIWRDAKDKSFPNDWQSRFSFSAWEYEKATDQYYLHLFTKKQPDLNWENKTVRDEVYDMMKFWLDKGVDGFRMDVISYIGKPSLEGSVGDFEANDAKTHEYLQEMNREVLSKYDIMTVGETPDVTPERAVDFTCASRNELNMVFQFEHVETEKAEDGSKWTAKKPDVYKIKQILSKWQTKLPDEAWNSLYLDNHDQPRQVSYVGNDSPEYRVYSAKMLATMLHTLKGTPYIYQGEELGMTNVKFENLSDYKDVEVLNYIKSYSEKHGISEEESFEELKPALYNVCRDNARTPVQWNSEKNAGFTTATPWIDVNPNYKEINAEQCLKDENSVFYYYKKLIELRKQNDVLVYGDIVEYLPTNPEVYVYTRTLGETKLLVMLNLTGNNVCFDLPKDIIGKDASVMISNYDNPAEIKENNELKPYEAVVYIKK